MGNAAEREHPDDNTIHVLPYDVRPDAEIHSRAVGCCAAQESQGFVHRCPIQSKSEYATFSYGTWILTITRHLGLETICEDADA